MYRRRATPLHAARAGAGSLFCLSLGLAALLLSAPALLLALLFTVAAVGVAAGARRPMGRTLLLGIPLAVTILVVNALVTRQGQTVIVRLGELPALGQTDITAEATVYGLVLALRAVILIMLGTLFSVAVDPDELLRISRRLSFRSALTATLATRLVPVLLRDSSRLADAQRCRPGPAPSRLQLMRAASSGVLDRALDVAAALEVRGYGSARRPPRRSQPYSRHDFGFSAAAVAIAALALSARAADLAPFRAYPALQAPLPVSEILVGLGLGAVALIPFVDRRGVIR